MLKAIMSKMKICKGEEKANEPQVVCGCFNITDQDIAKAISNGAKSFEEVQEITKVGTGCNSCSEGIKALVADLLLKQRIN